MSVQKQYLREEMRRRATEQDTKLQKKENSNLLQQIQSHHSWKKATTILLYTPMTYEPDLLSFLSDPKNSRRRFVFPRVHKKELYLYEWNPESSWLLGRFGLREPNPQQCSLVPVEKIELALIPGLAFDKKGGRLGHGHGFFDRLLSHPRWKACKLGIAWSWQIASEIPQEHFDVPMDFIVTPLEIHATPF